MKAHAENVQILAHILSLVFKADCTNLLGQNDKTTKQSLQILYIMQSTIVLFKYIRTIHLLCVYYFFKLKQLVKLFKTSLIYSVNKIKCTKISNTLFHVSFA